MVAIKMMKDRYQWKCERGRRMFEMIVGAMLLGEIVRVQTACMSTNLDKSDSRGGYCEDGTYNSGDICALYDNFEFTANEMCCPCGGGFWWAF